MNANINAPPGLATRRSPASSDADRRSAHTFRNRLSISVDRATESVNFPFDLGDSLRSKQPPRDHSPDRQRARARARLNSAII